MRALALAIALFTATAAQAGDCRFKGELGGLPDMTPACPADLRDFSRRMVECTHWMGEFNGDRSERDAEVNRNLLSLKCGTLEADYVALQKKYDDEPETLKALDDAFNLYEVELGE